MKEQRRIDKNNSTLTTLRLHANLKTLQHIAPLLCEYCRHRGCYHPIVKNNTKLKHYLESSYEEGLGNVSEIIPCEL